MYCTKCGRKLEDGEVCTCTQKTQVQHMQADPAQVKTPQMEQRQASGEQEQQEKNVFKNVHSVDLISCKNTYTTTITRSIASISVRITELMEAYRNLLVSAIIV